MTWSRARYLDIMEAALGAYAPEAVAAAIPPQGGLFDDIHACARVASVSASCWRVAGRSHTGPCGSR